MISVLNLLTGKRSLQINAAVLVAWATTAVFVPSLFLPNLGNDGLVETQTLGIALYALALHSYQSSKYSSVSGHAANGALVQLCFHALGGVLLAVHMLWHKDDLHKSLRTQLTLHFSMTLMLLRSLIVKDDEELDITTKTI